MSRTNPIRILVDADACPVKEEIYRVAFRRHVRVQVVSNSRLRVPDHVLIERVLVSDAFDDEARSHAGGMASTGVTTGSRGNRMRWRW